LLPDKVSCNKSIHNKLALK